MHTYACLSVQEKQWDYVVLQDNSSVPGGADEKLYRDTLAALATFFAGRMPPSGKEGGQSGRALLYRCVCVRMCVFEKLLMSWRVRCRVSKVGVAEHEARDVWKGAAARFFPCLHTGRAYARAAGLTVAVVGTWKLVRAVRGGIARAPARIDRSTRLPTQTISQCKKKPLKDIASTRPLSNR